MHERAIGTSRARRARMEEIVELLVALGHWARVDLEHVCEFDEYVAHELLFLRALARRGDGLAPKEIAGVLGWTKGRVSEVGAALEAKKMITRGPRLLVTAEGLGESESAAFAFVAVAKRMLEGVDARAQSELAGVLRKMRTNTAALSRAREDPSQL